jgi:integrase
VTGKQVMLTGSADDEDAAIKLRDKFRRQVADATAARTSVTVGYLLDEWLAGHQVEETTRTSYRVAIEKFIKPAVGDTSLTRLAQLGARPFEQLYAELRVCRRRCKGRTFIEHRAHECDERCVPHTCRPLSVSSVRECHAVLSGALNAAMRWAWIAVNPLEAVKRPLQQHPKPDPPTAKEAARIVSAAWERTSTGAPSYD